MSVRKEFYTDSKLNQNSIVLNLEKNYQKIFSFGFSLFNIELGYTREYNEEVGEYQLWAHGYYGLRFYFAFWKVEAWRSWYLTPEKTVERDSRKYGT